MNEISKTNKIERLKDNEGFYNPDTLILKNLEQEDAIEEVDVVSSEEYQALAANNQELAKRIDELVAQNKALQEQLNKLQAIIDSSR